MQAHGPLVLAIIAALGAAPAPALAAGGISFVRPVAIHGAIGPRVGESHREHGREMAWARPGVLYAAPVVLPPASEAVPSNAPADPTVAPSSGPIVFAAPECAQPRTLRSSGPHVIYVDEALSAPTRQSEGVTIIYGGSGG